MEAIQTAGEEKNIIVVGDNGDMSNVTVETGISNNAFKGKGSMEMPAMHSGGKMPSGGMLNMP